MKTLPLLGAIPGTTLRSTIVCPNCWHSFPPESALWIAVHSKVTEEVRLSTATKGEREQRRFLPERFDVEGHALDAEGAPCTQLACPRCRLQIPRASLEMQSLVLSIFGTPGSGKSVFLASMIFAMRKNASRLGLRFQDADLVLNKDLLDDERRLFLDSAAEDYRPIKDAVSKTQLGGARYRVANVDGHEAKFVPPYTFLVGPALGHPRADEEERLSRLLCLYDNAGEHFRAGEDAASLPATRHVAASKGLIFTFDPTQYRRLQSELGLKSRPESPADRQDAALLEAGRRIREHAGLAQTARVPQPLVVVVTKFDVWRPLLRESLDNLKLLATLRGTQVKALVLDAVETLSAQCRQVLWEYSREIVSAAESMAQHVIYVPVAALGWDVRSDPGSGMTICRTADSDPFGVLVPLLYLMQRSGSRLALSVRRKGA